MDHIPPAHAHTDSQAGADDALAALNPWHDGLGCWLSTFLRLRQLRRAEASGPAAATEPGWSVPVRPRYTPVAGRSFDGSVRLT